MKKIILLFAVMLSFSGFSQEIKHSHFYYQRADFFDKFPVTSKDIVFLGNSITNGCEWAELFGKKNIKNRGISGDISQGVYERLDNIVNGKPKKIFLLIGVNDIARKIPVETTSQNIEKIVMKIQQVSPKTKIYLQSVLPVNSDFKMFEAHQQPEKINELNAEIRQICQKYKVTYVDLYSHFIVPNTDKLKPELTNDGLHLMVEGYILWKKIVLPYF
ncbi:GDSL-type esterase/lipase family protein [Capnocytophaga stomatis]|uniref:GDSL-type esterase/lipase family protein n=1 Tax=Capnocytophaga stomatis TaxID=1848904 RepID=UPI001AD3E2AB|nr:GDSL-type esterase/lipase family protein [Capnocytophaga stomatis]GIM49965.1 sialate O-acetylesterase [Capnocytophaga stomatis]